MVVIESELEFKQEQFSNKTEQEIEQMINDNIQEDLCHKMEKELSEMSLLDMEPTDDGYVKIKASVVLMSITDMETSLSMLVTKLSKYMKEDEIEDALSVFEESKGGF